MANEDAGDFTIRELTGDKRTLRLVGRALPYRPFSLEGEQRADLWMPPGNPEGTLQIYGPSEKPTTIKGFWKTVFLGDETLVSATINGAALTTAKDLVQTADDIRRKGQIVEVTWLHEQRQGVLQRLKKDWHNLNDCEWEIEFLWSALSIDVLSAAQKILKSALRSAADFASKMASQVSDFGDKASPLTVPQTPQSSQIADALAKAQAAVDDLASGVDSATQGVTSAVTNARRAAASYEQGVLSMRGAINAAYARVESTAFGAPPTDLVGQQTAVVQANREAVRSARKALYLAAEAREQLLKSAEPNLITAFIARGNMDLRDVSSRFYGVPDNWRRLRTFNHLDSSRLSAGQVVFVPRLDGEVAA